MDLRIRYEKDIAIINFKKQVDICSVNFIDVTELLLRHGHTKILCNCCNVSGFDESGLYIVAMAFKNIRNKGGILKFCNVPGTDEKKFKDIHLDIIFEVGEDEKKALKEFDTIAVLHKLYQKRAYQRIDVQHRLVLTLENGQTYDAEIFNISEGGIFATCDKLFEIGTKVKFTLDVSSNRNYTKLDLEGEVHWLSSKDKDSPGGMGITFVNMDTLSQNKINKFVDETVAKIREILLKEMFYSRM